MLHAHEYGCTEHSDHYTDTMGTLKRNYMKISIFMRRQPKKAWFHDPLHSSIFKPTAVYCSASVQLQIQAGCQQLLLCSQVLHVKCVYKGGFLLKQFIYTHTHAFLISQETPLYLATADSELLSNTEFHWELLWSRISVAVASAAEVMGQSCCSYAAEVRAMPLRSCDVSDFHLNIILDHSEHRALSPFLHWAPALPVQLTHK